MKTIKLRNGARDRDYLPFGSNGALLEEVALIEKGGSVPASIKNIVLSAVQGDGAEMSLQSPVAQKEATQ